MALGIPTGGFLFRYIGSQLFGVAPANAGTFSAAVLILAITAGLAGVLPARRASRIDPIQALFTGQPLSVQRIQNRELSASTWCLCDCKADIFLVV